MFAMKRREFIAASAAVAASSLLPQTAAWARGRKVRLAMIGTGMRGLVLLKELVRRDDVEVVALCDIEPIMLGRATEMVAKAGKPAPKTYGQDRDTNAWKRLLEQKGIDGVIIATPWEYHAPMSIAAMQAGVAVGCEVVAGITLQDHWDVLKTQLSTGTPYMLLENVCYRRDVMAALQMVRQGLFGELVHLQAGYQHDLRGVKFNSGDPNQPYDSGVEFGPKGWSEARWRTEHSVERNGELYPSHGIGPCAMYTGINRGNRFTHINAFATKARGLHEYTVAKSGGTTHPSTKVKFKLGDIVTTTLACENGETTCCSTTPRCRARTRWASACRAPRACGWTSTIRSTSKAAARRTSGRSSRSTRMSTNTRCGSRMPTPPPAPATVAWTGSSSMHLLKR